MNIIKRLGLILSTKKDHMGVCQFCEKETAVHLVKTNVGNGRMVTCCNKCLKRPDIRWVFK